MINGLIPLPDKDNKTTGINNNKVYRNNEKPLPYGKGDYISIKKAEDKSKKVRKNTYPSTIPMGYSLYEEYQPVHFINFNAIRLQ